MSVPPNLPVIVNSNWFSRNWKWITGIAAIGLIVLVATLVLGVLAIMRNSDAYRGAMARVNSSSEVSKYLGSPVEDSLLFTGTVTKSMNSGRAELLIPISGPKGKGVVRVQAIFVDQKWLYVRCLIEANGKGAIIDLSDKQLPNKSMRQHLRWPPSRPAPLSCRLRGSRHARGK